MAHHQEAVYVSGWAASSVLTTCNNEVGPDLADYPYTTVPNQVQVSRVERVGRSGMGGSEQERQSLINLSDRML